MGNKYFQETKGIVKYLFQLKNFTVKSNNMVTLTTDDVNSLMKRLEQVENQLEQSKNEIKTIKDILRIVPSKILNSTEAQKRNYSTTTSETDGFNNIDQIAKRQNLNSYDFITVYTDGACENNGKINAKAGIGVWFGSEHPWNVSEPVKGKATNNIAEIQACIKAIQIAHEHGVKKLLIKTDSKFVINSMTQWIKRWKTNNWKLSTGGDVKNKTDFVELDKSISLLDEVKWEHVAGHSNIKGNEEADFLARQGAARYKN